MRDFEVGLREYEISVKEDVEIKGTGTVDDGGGAVAAEEALNEE
jgi:hypothetical protein